MSVCIRLNTEYPGRRYTFGWGEANDYPGLDVRLPRSVVTALTLAYLLAALAPLAGIASMAPTRPRHPADVVAQADDPLAAAAVHLVPFDDEWGWFFGASRSFVDEQFALYGDNGSATPDLLSQEGSDVMPGTPIPREVRFPDPLHAHIDRFWEARFQEVGRAYDPPQGVVAFDEPIATDCGRAEPEREAAFYCVLDETIYYSAEFRILAEDQIGDFAWVSVVAHEWGHHIQSTLGFDLGMAPDRAGEVVPIELEQQADCLAGAYAVDAEISGWLDPGDVDEALIIIEMAGVPPSSPGNDPPAHGASDERIAAWLKGYSTGLAGCRLDLARVDAAP